MNRIKSLCLLLLVAISGLSAAQPFSWNKILIDVVNQPLQAPESMSQNLSKAVDSMMKGGVSLGLAFSRLARESGNSFAATSASFADHYWLLGTTAATAAILYFYVYPRLTIHINFRHPDNQNNARR
jgi:hypothetical protein